MSNADEFVLSKDPAAVLDYSVDWTDWLVAGDSLASSSWAVEPVETGGVVVDSDSHAGPIATAWVSGGLAGREYRLTNNIVTADERTDERSIVLNVMNR